ncbi:hypothetical protein [uncultured Bacteroides sp.]|uniref:rhamnogalacturonan lyase family protein n=1 Tax=uncultured Bacteroides sp. TaxID=162156 RepID=UPI0025FE0A4D|nr:hypothetical protein [uncultured Bacteroides sp.]
MKKYYKYLWFVCLLAGAVACSDDSVVAEAGGGGDKELVDTELKLPSLAEIPDIPFAERAMWVSYDPQPGTQGTSTGIAPALISWRFLPSDPENASFNVYKTAGGKGAAEEQKLNEEPIVNSTCFQDADINNAVANYYRVTMIGSDSEGNEIEKTICDHTFTSETAQKFFREIKLRTDVPIPSITYKADDAQVGDLDGDGEMEIVVKREPYDGANQGGWRGEGTTLLEAYKMDGTPLWQIDMGINIRSGSHYTSYVLYDFDGDGKCEIAFRSSEGTRFPNGTITDPYGNVNDYRIRDDAGAGWYSGASLYTTCGLIFESPEYISICRGQDGCEITRVNNIPRGGEGSRVERAEYWKNYWGDDYGNRMDRFFIGVAYLDGYPTDDDLKAGRRPYNPSLIITRGVYANWQVWALDLKGNKLETRWKFDTAGHSSKWLGMCSHAFRVADLNDDGKDEILYGQAAIRSDGEELWCTGNGHGDVLHVGKFIQDKNVKKEQGHGKLQIVASFEESNTYNNQGYGYGCQVIDAKTGKFITGHGKGSTADVGRCIVADVDPDSEDFEYWSSLGEGMFSCSTGTSLGNAPTGIGGGTLYNVAIYWTGGRTRELYDRALIVSKQNGRIVQFDTYGSNQGNHSTKFNPCYIGDFLGDYREEVILGSKDYNSIYIFSTNWMTNNRLRHLMTDHTYDMSQAMQNIGYNQGTNLGYYVGAETLK